MWIASTFRYAPIRICKSSLESVQKCVKSAQHVVLGQGSLWTVWRKLLTNVSWRNKFLRTFKSASVGKTTVTSHYYVFLVPQTPQPLFEGCLCSKPQLRFERKTPYCFGKHYLLGGVSSQNTSERTLPRGSVLHAGLWWGWSVRYVGQKSQHQVATSQWHTVTLTTMW